MAIWNPIREWEGQDAFIIGGGPSLVGFDFNLLRGKNVVGCNDAFTLGSAIVPYCFFGDAQFYDDHEEALSNFDGIVVTNSPRFLSETPPRLRVMKRQPRGLGIDKIAWNGNSGAAAVNLALILGAKRVFLLGIDMNPEIPRTHWHHDGTTTKSRKGLYAKFQSGFARIKNALEDKFPGCEVINLNPDSQVESFRKAKPKEYLNE